MTDAEAEAQKVRVMAVWERWSRPLGLGYQRKTSFSWHRGAIPDYPEAAMTCRSNWQYKEVCISVDLTQISDKDDADLEFMIVHECMHVFLQGLVEGHHQKIDRDAFRMIEENTATNLAQAFIWIRVTDKSEDAEAA